MSWRAEFPEANENKNCSALAYVGAKVVCREQPHVVPGKKVPQYSLPDGGMGTVGWGMNEQLSVP